MKLFGLIGAGGYGREVMPLAQTMLNRQFQSSDFELVFVVENKDSAILKGYRILEITEFLNISATEKYFNIAIANSEVRQRLAELMLSKNIPSFRIHHATFVELGYNQIDEGAIFSPFSLITADAKIGKFFHSNIYSYVAHDCIIGDYVTFAPNVHCNGNVIIEDHVYVGTGAIIREGKPGNPLVIGKGAVLGMGSVITKSIPPFEVVVGNPARTLKRKEIF